MHISFTEELIPQNSLCYWLRASMRQSKWQAGYFWPSQQNTLSFGTSVPSNNYLATNICLRSRSLCFPPCWRGGEPLASPLMDGGRTKVASFLRHSLDTSSCSWQLST